MRLRAGIRCGALRASVIAQHTVVSTPESPTCSASNQIVEQTFAFEHGQDPLRRSQLAKHGGGGDSVGWRDDGAERDRRRPWHRGDEHVNDERNCGRRKPHGGQHNRRDEQSEQLFESFHSALAAIVPRP